MRLVKPWGLRCIIKSLTPNKNKSFIEIGTSLNKNKRFSRSPTGPGGSGIPRFLSGIQRTTGSCRPKTYFPIQKFAKILPNNSSFVTSPVISPKKYKASRMSMATKSEDTPVSMLPCTFCKASKAFKSAS